MNEKKYISDLLMDEIDNIFNNTFSRTPLGQRLEDISKQVTELTRYTDLRKLKEKAGDSLISLLMLFNESGFSVNEAISKSLEKIESRSQYKSLGRKKNVAILGGAFNPITEGHLKTAQLVLNVSKFYDEVWLMPCDQHMYNKELVDAKHRFNMCNIVAGYDGRIKTFSFELENKLAGETYHTFKKIMESEYVEEHDFSLIMGMDNANTFHQWYNYKELEKLVRMVVVPRAGEKRDEKVNWYLKEPHIFLQPEGKNQIPEISSTQIREWLKEDYYRIPFLQLQKNLNSEVLNYIVKNNLYR